MHGFRYQNSALNNANVNTNRKESNNVWLAQEDFHLRSDHGVWICLGDYENMEKTEAGAGLLSDERKRSIIMDPQNSSRT